MMTDWGYRSLREGCHKMGTCYVIWTRLPLKKHMVIFS